MKKVICFLIIGATLSLFADAEPTKLPPKIQKNSLCPVAAIEQAVPSVVFVANQTSHFEKSFGKGSSYFYNFFKYFYESIWPSRYSMGSGFLVSSEGHIVTNHHVISDATSVEIAMRQPMLRVVKARIIGSDEKTDIAVLKIEKDEDTSYKYLSFGNSDELKQGQSVYAIGSPASYRLESSVSGGIVSSTERTNTFMHDVDGFIQTDVKVNGGNSGGPLLNSKGEVVGVISWKYDTYYGYEGLAFAIPSNKAKKIVNQLIKHEVLKTGFLGVELKSRKEKVFNKFHFEHHDGAEIADVINHSEAKKAGLKKGDIIVSIDGKKVTTIRSTSQLISVHPPGEEITLTVKRDEETLTFTITLGEFTGAVMKSALSKYRDMYL